VFALLLKYCSQMAQVFVRVCPKLYRLAVTQKTNNKDHLSKTNVWHVLLLCIFKHIPTNAYTTVAEMFQQEFKHPKFKHLMELPIATRRPSKMVTTCICCHLIALHFFFECVSE
jgi:hypothetical protein